MPVPLTSPPPPPPKPPIPPCAARIPTAASTRRRSRLSRRGRPFVLRPRRRGRPLRIRRCPRYLRRRRWIPRRLPRRRRRRWPGFRSAGSRAGPGSCRRRRRRRPRPGPRRRRRRRRSSRRLPAPPCGLAPRDRQVVQREGVPIADGEDPHGIRARRRDRDPGVARGHGAVDRDLAGDAAYAVVDHQRRRAERRIGVGARQVDRLPGQRAVERDRLRRRPPPSASASWDRRVPLDPSSALLVTTNERSWRGSMTSMDGSCRDRRLGGAADGPAPLRRPRRRSRSPKTFAQRELLPRLMIASSVGPSRPRRMAGAAPGPAAPPDRRGSAGPCPGVPASRSRPG